VLYACEKENYNHTRVVLIIRRAITRVSELNLSFNLELDEERKKLPKKSSIVMMGEIKNIFCPIFGALLEANF
jgi:hypothetical protein